MKIVIVHNSYQQPGGEDIVFRNECDLLKGAGHAVIEYQRSNHDVSKYVSIRQLALAKTTIWASDTRREFRELLLRERPDVVHVHNTFVMVSPSIYWACRDARVPVVQTLHNYRLLCPGANFFRDGKVCEECLDHGVWRGVRYSCYQGSNSATAVVAAMLTTHRFLGTWPRLIEYFLAPTEFARRKFIKGGFPQDKILVKPNFVDPDPGEGTGDRSYALFVGRLSPEKGLRTVLDAWTRLGNTIPLHIVGDGPLRTEFEEYVRQHGLSNVRFLGRLAWKETMAAMKGARCLLFPSECYEGALPLTVVEAFACGTPVIASRLGAMQDLIADGSTGLHFTPGDADDLASKAKHAWTHPEILDSMRQQARRAYETTYTAARNYEMLLETYERAIRNNEARRAGLVVDRLNPAWRFESHPEESYRVSGYSPKVAQHLASPENQDL
jgi:glycosyltransferase involved in cell wall biosynthesis